MNFGFSEEQELLRSTARKFFDNECSSTVVRTLMDTPDGITPELWAKLGEQGWLGLIYPEAYDGMGLGLVDLVVLMEEMGRAVVPGPYFSTVLLGGLAILEAGSEAQKKEWLPKLATGGKRVTLAWTEPSATIGPEGVTLPAAEKSGTFTLSGTKLFVPDAHTADAIVVAARTRMGKPFFSVSRPTARISRPGRRGRGAARRKRSASTPAYLITNRPVSRSGQRSWSWRTL